MSVKLLTDYHLEFLSLKGGFTGSSESTLVKIPHCWKSHVTAHNIFLRHCYLCNTCVREKPCLNNTEENDNDN